MVWSHAVNYDLCSLRHRAQFLFVELDSQDLYYELVRAILSQGRYVVGKYLAQRDQDSTA